MFLCFILSHEINQMETSLSSVLVLLCVHKGFSQEDPCQPNPCGDNTRCSSTFISESPVISCECLIGFKVPEGGDPFDGCYEVSSLDSFFQVNVGRKAKNTEI